MRAPRGTQVASIVQGDALSLLDTPEFMAQFDAVHASPPCQGYSTQTADRTRHERLIGHVRTLLEQSGLPYVIENVEGAAKELRNPVRLCGSSFGLDVRRHRYFETNWPLVAPPCNHAWQTPRFRSLDMKSVRAGRLASVVGVHGHINYAGESPIRARAMGIDWMTDAELAESIPPAYTAFVGAQLAAFLRARVAS
jgi:DNA (cytosine-5)-methyltransferase 1